jgi:hypothetical protein
VQSDEEQGSSSPTLNQLLSSESITEEELEEMFKGEGTSVAPEEKKEKKSGKDEASEDAFIEIVEFDDDRQ